MTALRWYLISYISSTKKKKSEASDFPLLYKWAKDGHVIYLFIGDWIVLAQKHVNLKFLHIQLFKS